MMTTFHTIITNGQQAKGQRHEPGVGFVCADCGETRPVQHGGGTGYARDDKDNLICYECCGKRDRAEMIETGKATMYLTQSQSGTLRLEGGHGHAEVTNWPGTLRFPAYVRRGSHNIAGRRYDVWFWGPDGHRWHGVQYGDNTQICHCKRTKEKSASAAA